MFWGVGASAGSAFAFVMMALILTGACLPGPALSAPEKKPDYSLLTGKWVRPDGGYVIHVRSIESDGAADASYSNPSEIHVAEAKVSMKEGSMKLYMRLEGKGYPVSTYTLYYYAEKDALAGFYYQAAMDQTFEVVFIREKAE